jgi:membrane glycosyltransferase
MLWFQSRAVLQVMLGADGGWSAANRGGGRMSLNDAWQSSRIIVLTGTAAMVFTITAAPDLVWWLLPITIPMVIAPFLIWGTSQSAESGIGRYMFRAPTEVEIAPVMALREEILSEWQKTSPEEVLLPSLFAAEPTIEPPPPQPASLQVQAGA